MQMKRKLTQLRNLVADHQIVSFNNFSVPQEMIIQNEMVEENISKLKEITKLMKKNHKMVEGNLQHNTSLGEIFDQYSRSANNTPENRVLCACLQDASLFQKQISKSQTQMDEKVNQILYTTIKNFINDGLKPATETKKRFDKDAKEYDSMISKVKSSKKNGKLDSKKEQELDNQLNEMKRSFEANEKDTLDLLKQANQKSELITILKIVEYWESCIKYYQEGIQYIESLAPKIEKYKAYARRASTQKALVKLFKQPLEVICERESRRVPKIIVSACNYITKEGLDVQGIFRVSATKSSMEALKDEVEETSNYDFTKHGPIVVSGLLKLFLRELPDPLFTFERYKSFLAAAKLENESKQLEEIKKIIASLPLYNFKSIQHITKMCVVLSQASNINKMTESNLSTVLAPNLLYTNDVDPIAMVYEMEQANNIFTFIIKNYSMIFEVEDFDADSLNEPVKTSEVDESNTPNEKKLKRNKSYRQVGSLREKSTRKIGKKGNRHTNNIADFEDFRSRSSSFDVSIMDPKIFEPPEIESDEGSVSPIRSSPRQLKKSKGSLKNIFVSDTNKDSDDESGTTPPRLKKEKKKKKKSLTPDVSGLRNSRSSRKIKTVSGSEKQDVIITGDDNNSTSPHEPNYQDDILKEVESITWSTEGTETNTNIKKTEETEETKPTEEAINESKPIEVVTEEIKQIEVVAEEIIPTKVPNITVTEDALNENTIEPTTYEITIPEEIHQEDAQTPPINEENESEKQTKVKTDVSPPHDLVDEEVHNTQPIIVENENETEIKTEKLSPIPDMIVGINLDKTDPLISDNSKESLVSDASKESLSTIPREVNELLKSQEFKLSLSTEESIDALERSDSITSESLPLSIPDPVSELYPLLIPGNFNDLASSICHLISCCDRSEFNDVDKKGINGALKELAKFTKVLLSQSREYVRNFPEMRDAISTQAVNIQKDIRNIIVSLKDFHNDPKSIDSQRNLFNYIKSFDTCVTGFWASSLTSLKIQIDSSLELAIQKTASHISQILRAALSKTLDEDPSHMEANLRIDTNEVVKISYLRGGLLDDHNAHSTLDESIQELQKYADSFIKCLSPEDDIEDISVNLSVQAKNLVKSFRTIESIVKEDTLGISKTEEILELRNNLSNLTIALATKVFKNTSLSLDSKLLVLSVGPYVRRLIKDTRRWIQNDISNLSKRDIVDNVLSIKNQLFEIISLINYHQLDGNLKKQDEELILTNISSILVSIVKILLCGSIYSITKDSNILKQFLSTQISLLKLIESALVFEKNY